jgi:hypothetical protein
MMKSIAIAIISGGLLSGTSAAAADGAYLELAVYTVKNSTEFPAVRAQAEKHLQVNAPGFLWWKRLQGDNGNFADILAWASPADAKKAAVLVQSDESLQPFVSSIQTVTHFGHYRATVDPTLLGEQIDSAPLIEIALYTVRDATTHAIVHQRLYDHLANQQGMLGGTRLMAEGTERGFGDLLTWKNVASWEATGQALMQLPELSAFFEGTDTSHVFALFTRDEAK